MKYIGAHVSISGGVENAPINAAKIGAKAFAMFVKNQRQWTAPAIKEESIIKFKENCKKYNFSMENILPHDGYLINLGQPDKEKRAKSINAFIDEMQRCHSLGLKMLNFHPGSHLKEITIDEELALIADSIKQAFAEVPDVIAVFENTAGQGSNVGYEFEQIAKVFELIGSTERLGVCFDTCHGYAAGYDLVSEEGYEKTFDEFNRLIGLEFLRGIHLNDSKSVLGGKLDRHHSLGEGYLGWPTFERIMKDIRFDNIPIVLETIDEEKWPQEIAKLYSFIEDK